MPEKPVARLALDTRAHGPYFCEKCDAENEDALLMSDASVVCPECKAVMPEFEQFSSSIISASPIRKTEKHHVPGAERWIIEWTNIDSSRDSSNVYDTKKEALDVAADWIKEYATNEIESVDWDEGDKDDREILNSLKQMVEDASKGKHRDAIIAWLDYQSDWDPEEKMSIGPSGNVSDRSGDFAYMTK